MTTEQHAELIIELRGIRAAIERALKASAPKPATAGAEDIPLPVAPVTDAENVEVHFGKNKGNRLGSLGAKSVEWYAKEPEPRLRNDGTPFPPRPDDVRLREAARTLVHQRRGTIPMPANKPILEPVVSASTEEVPF
ncbi:MAG: hypothetical protein ACR2J8_09525, partial [Thermomicrobiales bacterium]